MPKFLVKMNVVEAKETTFIIEADNEDDVHDGLGEFSDSYFERNCDWITVDYEPPIIEKVMKIAVPKDWQSMGKTRGSKNKRIQDRFSHTIKKLSNESE